jgi:hypothetical protein
MANSVCSPLEMANVLEYSVFAPYRIHLRTDSEWSRRFGTVLKGRSWIDRNLMMGDVFENSIFSSYRTYFWTDSAGVEVLEWYRRGEVGLIQN